MIRFLNPLNHKQNSPLAWHVLAAVLVLLPGWGGSPDMHAQSSPATKGGMGSQDHRAPQTLTARELSRRAEIIAIGRVADMRSEWDEGKRRIRTITTIEVAEVLKGTVPTRLLTVVTPGGEVGEVGELYSHNPRFVREEETCVFLTPDNKGSHRVVGGDAGKLTITTDKRSGRKMVGEAQSLDDFKAQLSRYIEEQSKK